MRDHLTEQLQLALARPGERLIGRHLIDMVDEAGYLRADLDGAGREARRAASARRGVLGMLQTLRSARRRSRATCANAWRCS